MARDGLLIGEVARRSGATRKALRVYETAGILPPSRRTLSGHRIYTAESLAVLSFLQQARRLDFTLDEIKRIVAIRRQAVAPAPTFASWSRARFRRWTSG
jgi:MerR family transcriptional regulator, copper efflux regulator